MPSYSSSNGEQSAPALKHHKQISDSHCGPAVVQMLLAHLDIHVSQPALVHAAGADTSIEEHGMTIGQLAKGVKKTAPSVQFWWKDYTTIEDLDTLIHQYGYPVGVEWQSLFYETIEDEEEDTEGEQYDFGHYSIVKDIDLESEDIVMVDPFREFVGKDRFFNLKWFEQRWWDINDVNINGLIRQFKENRVSFVLTHKGVYFPKLLDMKPAA